MLQRITRRGGCGRGPPARHQVRFQRRRQADGGSSHPCLTGIGPQGEAGLAQALDCISPWQHHDHPTIFGTIFQGELGGRHRRRGYIGNAAATAQHAAVCAAGDWGGAVNSRHCPVASACRLKLLCCSAEDARHLLRDWSQSKRTNKNIVLVWKYWRHLPSCHTAALRVPNVSMTC